MNILIIAGFIFLFILLYAVWKTVGATRNPLTEREQKIYNKIMDIVAEPNTKITGDSVILFINNKKHDIRLLCLTGSLIHNGLTISINKRLIKKIYNGIMCEAKKANINELLEK